MSTLLLRLAAPLQSWGVDSKFETRRTGKEPTKSGVTGMLAAALGLQRDSDLSMLNALRFGIRVDREGELLRDYHTARSEKTSYVTNRYYLSDAVFLAGLESEDKEFLRMLETALRNPSFPLFLGRRSCPPTQPLVLGVRPTDLENSLEREPMQAYPRKGYEVMDTLRMVLECGSTEANASLQKDLPLSFSPARRQYGFRALKERVATIFPGTTEHDAMSEC